MSFASIRRLAGQGSAVTQDSKWPSTWSHCSVPIDPPSLLPIVAAVSYDAGTLAAFYYKNVKEFDLPTKDHLFAAQQDEKFNVQQFDVRTWKCGRTEKSPALWTQQSPAHAPLLLIPSLPLQTYVNGYAVGLVEGYGVKKGTKVALWMGNDVENVSMTGEAYIYMTPGGALP